MAIRVVSRLGVDRLTSLPVRSLPSRPHLTEPLIGRNTVIIPTCFVDMEDLCDSRFDLEIPFQVNMSVMGVSDVDTDDRAYEL